MSASKRLASECVGRSDERTRFGLVNDWQSASLPKVVKPATAVEATSAGIQRAVRGARGRHAQKGEPGTWETPERIRGSQRGS